MVKMEVLLGVILPQVLPCPKSMALDVLQTVSMDFCRETGVWQENVQAPVTAHDNVLYPDLPAKSVIVEVQSIYINDSKIESGEYEAAGREIIFKSCPRENGYAFMKVSLRPERQALELPEDIVEEWGDALAFGTIAKLKSMSGLRIEWTDAAGANVNNQLYQESLATAKGRIFKRRYGGILYANMGEYDR